MLIRSALAAGVVLPPQALRDIFQPCARSLDSVRESSDLIDPATPADRADAGWPAEPTHHLFIPAGVHSWDRPERPTVRECTSPGSRPRGSRSAPRSTGLAHSHLRQ